MRPVFQSSVMRRAMLSPMPRTSVRVPASMIPPRSEVRLSSARAAFSYARTLKGFSPLSSRRPAISSRMRATSRTSTRNSVRDWFARGGLGKLGQRPSTGESFLGRMPVHDLRLAETPAEADHPVARHGVEVDQPQVEILEDASVRGDLVQRGAELLEEPRAPRLVLPERAHVLTPARRARGLDGDQHPHLPLERRDLPGHRRERSQGLREIGNQTVRFFHREDLVPDSFHIGPREGCRFRCLPRGHVIRGSRALATRMGIGQELRDVLNEETVNRILQEALARGGDAADLFAEQRFRTSFVLDSGKIDSVTYGYPRGAGVRVVLRNQTGYAFSDELTYNSILDAARIASSIVETPGRANPIDVTRRSPASPFALVNPEPLLLETAKLDVLQRMDTAARAADPRIVSVRIEYVDEVREVLIGTSEGIYIIDRQYLTSIACTPVAQASGKRASGLATLGGRVDAEYFARVSPEDAAKAAALQAVRLLDAGPAPAGPMPVVVAPGWGGVLVHESLGHALEADGIRRGTSLLSGLQGTRIV